MNESCESRAGKRAENPVKTERRKEQRRAEKFWESRAGKENRKVLGNRAGKRAEKSWEGRAGKRSKKHSHIKKAGG